MPGTLKRLEELLDKANSLPLCPGVYIMRDRNQKIIYVGKSKVLKNRVSQYFQQSKKNTKTFNMVSAAEDFDYILCKTEIEALSLENALIKQHSPKYNIKLKDAKSYPYIKVTECEYPRLTFTRSRGADKGKYFGPFSGSSVAYSILDTLNKSLGLPTCKRKFPQDIGKERPCIYYQIKQCCGPCTGKVTKEEYHELIDCAIDVLKGNISGATKSLNEQMYRFAEEENFEAAARCRDTVKALERLNQKQSVVAAPDVDMDVFGFYSDESASCMSVMYVRNGALGDKTDFVFNSDAIIDGSTLLSFLVEHYVGRDVIPKNVYVSFDIDENDTAVIEEFLSEKSGHRVYVRKPVRGSNKDLCMVAQKNAQEKARQTKLEAQRDEGVLVDLLKLLRLEALPQRIEAYDISNIGKENITAGMVVYENAKPKRSEYRLFKMKTVTDTPDDYASMKEALLRRLKYLNEEKESSFSAFPDLILVDGGKGHVSVAKEALAECGIDIPVFGMVKDEYHKTRALCTENEKINIARERSVFVLIYSIQEEVHRFTVGRVSASKRSTMKHSSLEQIEGIGPLKAKKLLAGFGTLARLKNATESEISALKGISAADAHNVYVYFNNKKENDENNNRKSKGNKA